VLLPARTQCRELRELPDLVARPLDHCGTLWITPEGAPPTRMECSRPGGKGGGRPPNTTGSLASRAPPPATRPRGNPLRHRFCGRRTPRRSIRVPGSAGRTRSCPRGGRGQGEGGRVSAEPGPVYGARPAVRQTTRRGRREIRSCISRLPIPPAGSSPAAWAEGGLPRGSPQSLPAVKRTRTAVRGWTELHPCLSAAQTPGCPQKAPESAALAGL
jgi:hypothetical protein